MSEGLGRTPAIFVDDSGAKGRKASVVAKVIGLAAFAYVVLMLATLARAPWVPGLSLPGLGDAAPNAAQAPPALGPGATVTPIPDDTASSDTPGSTTEPPTTTASTTASTATTSLPPQASTPATTAPGQSTTTTTTTRPGNGPPTSIPGNGGGPPTTTPAPN